MVSIQKKKRGNKDYYYLEHSIRIKGKVETREHYLGNSIPVDIEEIKQEFLDGIDAEIWFDSFDKIKQNHLKEKKKMPTTAWDKALEIFAIRFTYNTNRIEGSTLTLRETASLLEEGVTPSNRPMTDVKEAEAHERVFFEMLGYERDLSYQKVLYWHRELFKETKSDIAGRVRDHQVAISGSKYDPPMAIELEALLNDFFKWYRKARKSVNPVKLAALVHLRFVSIHPFSDGNGRTSRLMMNFVLNKNGYPMMDIPYRKRNSYYNALERSQVKNDERIFLLWSYRRYLKDHSRFLI